MGRRGWTAEEADDFISEHGTGVMPWELHNDDHHDVDDEAPLEEGEKT